MRRISSADTLSISHTSDSQDESSCSSSPQECPEFATPAASFKRCMKRRLKNDIPNVSLYTHNNLLMIYVGLGICYIYIGTFI